MQRDPVVSKASELLRLGLMPSPEELRAGKVRLLLYPLLVRFSQELIANVALLEFAYGGHCKRSVEREGCGVSACDGR